MWATYENKTADDIKQDIKTEFKRIEKNKRWRYRDDQEIYEAWENIITKYINQLSNADWMRVSNEKRWVKGNQAQLVKSENLYKWEALKYFKDAKAKFSKRWNEVLKEHWIFWMYITSSSANEKQINEIAKDIDKAEEEALKKIKMSCNPKQEQHNASEHNSVVRDNQWKVKVNNWEVMRQKPLFTQSNDWTLTFTDRVNPLNINQALGDLFKNKDKIYKINYTRCTNQKIKNKMQSLIWWLSCWIKYDKNCQSYILTDRTWKILGDRALVWEWVTLKQDTIIESQAKQNNWNWMSNEEHASLEAVRASSFKFNASNYLYYKQYHDLRHQDICAAYAYWVVSDILSKSWCCFNATEVNTWDMLNSSHITWKVNINQINNTNPKQQIIDAPAGTFLTVKYKKTSHQDKWVSHVMVSLWNGIYTDLFWSNIRQFDIKSEATFTWNTFRLRGGEFTITNESRLFTPNMWNLPTWSKQTIQWRDISPEDFAKQVHDTTWANMNYIRSLIAKQNNITAEEWRNLNKKYENLSVNIISKEITDLEIENKENSNNIAKDFLTSLKDNKREIMNRYPNLTNHEYDEIAKRAMWILYQESNAWDSLKYHWKETVHNLTFSCLPGSRSRWYTQIKFDQTFNSDDKQFLKNFGINNGRDLTNAKKCWIATMIWLIGNYNSTIIPMKSDPFWRNDAKIINLTFKDDKKADIAIWKPIRINGVKRPRTMTEIEEKITELENKHWWLKERKEITRLWIRDNDTFFDFLYYTRNRPSEITYWTATPKQNNYIAQANNYANQNLIA